MYIVTADLMAALFVAGDIGMFMLIMSGLVFCLVSNLFCLSAASFLSFFMLEGTYMNRIIRCIFCQKFEIVRYSNTFMLKVLSGRCHLNYVLYYLKSPFAKRSVQL